MILQLVVDRIGRVLKAEQLSLFVGEGKISRTGKNYLGTDKRGRAHWRAHAPAPNIPLPEIADADLHRMIAEADAEVRGRDAAAAAHAAGRGFTLRQEIQRRRSAAAHANEKELPEAEPGKWYRDGEVAPQTPDPRPGPYFVTAVDGAKVFFMAGPFDKHADALAAVDASREAAYKLDPRAHWMAWGTARAPERKVPGRLTSRGIIPADVEPDQGPARGEDPQTMTLDAMEREIASIDERHRDTVGRLPPEIESRRSALVQARERRMAAATPPPAQVTPSPVKMVEVSGDPIKLNDPQAVAKLTERIRALKAVYSDIQRVNDDWRRRHGRTARQDMRRQLLDDLMASTHPLVADSIRQNIRENGENGLRANPVPYHFQTNIYQRIAAYRERLGRVKDSQARTAAEGGAKTLHEGGGVRIFTAPEADRIRIAFDERPTPEITSMLKRRGWRWSPTNGVWQRQLTDNARYAAESFFRDWMKRQGPA